MTWLFGELSFFCKSACSADPARACSLCSRVSSRHVSPRHEPSSLPAGPSVRPVPLGALSSLRAHSRVTRHPCLAAKLTSENFNHGEFNSDRIKQQWDSVLRAKVLPFCLSFPENCKLQIASFFLRLHEESCKTNREISFICI